MYNVYNIYDIITDSIVILAGLQHYVPFFPSISPQHLSHFLGIGPLMSLLRPK